MVEDADDYGSRAEDVVVDQLVKSIGALNDSGQQVMHILNRLRDELKVNSNCCASNVSFGLPNRNGLNAAFLTMAIGAGMTSAITSPLHGEVMAAVMGADVMMGHDPDCKRWIARYRDPLAEGQSGVREGRRGGRRRAAGG